MEKNLKEMKLQVEGMTCTGCAMDIKNVLHAKEGILDVSVNYTDDTFNIQYDADLIDRKRVFLTVRKLVFKTKIISES